jgi:hypothetical protein
LPNLQTFYAEKLQENENFHFYLQNRGQGRTLHLIIYYARARKGRQDSASGMAAGREGNGRTGRREWTDGATEKDGAHAEKPEERREKAAEAGGKN